MQKIINYNCDGLCIHRFCGKKYTHFTYIRLRGMDLSLGFCEKHSEEFENNRGLCE